MPSDEWTCWTQVAETFVAERPHADDEMVVAVLVFCLRGARGWGDFSTGEWLGLVSVEIYMADIPGYSHLRAFLLLDRFVGWLHARGEIDDWQRDVLHTKIDDAREASGSPRKRATRTRELLLSDLNRDRLFADFAATLGDGQPGASIFPVLRLVESALRGWVETSRSVPLGALDPDAFIELCLAESDSPLDLRFTAHVFAVCGRFYRWLGDTGRLDRRRAHLIASRLASACFGIAA